jgi:predicted metal-dependent hydrolase
MEKIYSNGRRLKNVLAHEIAHIVWHEHGVEHESLTKKILGEDYIDFGWGNINKFMDI